MKRRVYEFVICGSFEFVSVTSETYLRIASLKLLIWLDCKREFGRMSRDKCGATKLLLILGDPLRGSWDPAALPKVVIIMFPEAG